MTRTHDALWESLGALNAGTYEIPAELKGTIGDVRVKTMKLFHDSPKEPDPTRADELIHEMAEMVEPTVHVALCRDSKDDIFLDAAIAGRVHYLVTGDDDLKGDQTLKTKLRDEYGVQIMGVPKFLAVRASIK